MFLDHGTNSCVKRVKGIHFSEKAAENETENLEVGSEGSNSYLRIGILGLSSGICTGKRKESYGRPLLSHGNYLDNSASASAN